MTWFQKSKSIGLIGFDILFLFLPITAISLCTYYMPPVNLKRFPRFFDAVNSITLQSLLANVQTTNQEGSLFCGTFTCQMKRFHRGFGTNYSEYHSRIQFGKPWICLRFSLSLELNQDSRVGSGKRNNVTRDRWTQINALAHILKNLKSSKLTIIIT